MCRTSPFFDVNAGVVFVVVDVDAVERVRDFAITFAPPEQLLQLEGPHLRKGSLLENVAEEFQFNNLSFNSIVTIKCLKLVWKTFFKLT